MSKVSKRYVTREELHKDNLNDEKAICQEVFSSIFKVNRKLDEKGQLIVNFELLKCAEEHIPELNNNTCYDELIGNLTKREDAKLVKIPYADRGLNYKEFTDVVIEDFINCDPEIKYMFDDLKNKKTGRIGFQEVHELMDGCEGFCSHNKHSQDDIKSYIASVGKAHDDGLDWKEFYALMTSKQF